MSNRQINRTTKTLMDARSLIEDKANWCQNMLKNEHGQYCAMGALYQATRLWEDSRYMVNHPAYCLLSQIAEEEFGLEDIAYVNDERGHSATLEMFDYAIALSIEEEKR